MNQTKIGTLSDDAVYMSIDLRVEKRMKLIWMLFRHRRFTVEAKGILHKPV